jgi:hypothetical protein
MPSVPLSRRVTQTPGTASGRMMPTLNQRTKLQALPPGRAVEAE